MQKSKHHDVPTVAEALSDLLPGGLRIDNALGVVLAVGIGIPELIGGVDQTKRHSEVSSALELVNRGDTEHFPPLGRLREQQSACRKQATAMHQEDAIDECLFHFHQPTDYWESKRKSVMHPPERNYLKAGAS